MWRLVRAWTDAIDEKDPMLPLLLIGDGAEKSQAKSRNNQVERKQTKRSLMRRNKQWQDNPTLAKNYWAIAHLECMQFQKKIYKNNLSFVKIGLLSQCTLLGFDAF